MGEILYNLPYGVGDQWHWELGGGHLIVGRKFVFINLQSYGDGIVTNGDQIRMPD